MNIKHKAFELQARGMTRPSLFTRQADVWDPDTVHPSIRHWITRQVLAGVSNHEHEAPSIRVTGQGHDEAKSGLISALSFLNKGKAES